MFLGITGITTYGQQSIAGGYNQAQVGKRWGCAMSDRDRGIIDFAIFLIHRVAKKWGMTAPEVYKMLDSVDIVDGYIVKHYDVLHTLGEEYLVDGITSLARKRGVLS